MMSHPRSIGERSDDIAARHSIEQEWALSRSTGGPPRHFEMLLEITGEICNIAIYYVSGLFEKTLEGRGKVFEITTSGAARKIPGISRILQAATNIRAIRSSTEETGVSYAKETWVSKSPTALHAIALETINTRFPPEEWLHVYTDGSLLDFAQGAGIGVFSHLFSFYLHAGPLTTHFDGEVEAIHIALQQLAVRLPPIERAVILSDSTSALQALSNYNENNCLRVQNCRELLGKIKGKIVFQWVPSHCGLWGNERADFLAKKGTGILQNFRRDLTLHSAKLEIKRIFRESFRLTASRVARDKPWSTLRKKSHGIPSSPRAAAVAKFRLLTGHDCLCAHLFRFNLVTSPICVLCDTG
ncbi:uncharacterized protein LOC103524116 [Trichonephila clavipes]|nr:uncharacterized protein LOC103524116 [Trichonephila clavipes]